MIPLWVSEGSVKPFGFPMSQNRLSPTIWSYAMEVYPPTRVLDLGCYNGGFTILLGLHAWHLGATVFGFDRMAAPSEDWANLAKVLGVEFVQGDILQGLSETIIRLIEKPGITYVLCDNGKKSLEFSIFAQHLKPGDIIGAHDYFNAVYWPWTEITQEAVAEPVARYGLEPWMQEHFDLAGWLVYKK